MRKFSLITSIASATLILSGSAFADASVSGGVITADDCVTRHGTGAVCSAPVTGDGFLQRQVNVGGATYYETYITPEGATASDIRAPGALAFFDVSVVQRGVSGIRDEQGIHEDAAGKIFTASSGLNIGWANTGAYGNTVSLSQATSEGDLFSSSFNLELLKDAAGAIAGKDLAITQDTNLVDLDGTPGSQNFTHEFRSGDLSLAGSITMIDPAATVVTFAAGDDVTHAKVLQEVAGALFEFESVDVNGVVTRYVKR